MQSVKCIMPKRQRTAALQDAPRGPVHWKVRQLLECGSPLPLFCREMDG